ncbi:hypothetical protein DY000_02009408 [Brassica cretica]|uniref:Expansin-like EG45 domain-containing protein n=1 Tax=Brassica cretica TaxID=69181 RepID=A0ABQ7CFE2_BRACR|nr:hypothetical protein DY000_02009408 [Brassica cretica]
MFCRSWKRIAWDCALVLIFVIALASDGSNITNFSLSVPDSFGRVVDGLGVWSTEYGGCSPFCSDRHPVQVVSGPNKCLVSLLRVGKVATVAVCSCMLVLRSSRRAVLRWAIIFKSGFIGEAKIIGFRLSVELGSSFCGKLLVRIGRASRLRC